jgi:hypothetical protein
VDAPPSAGASAPPLSGGSAPATPPHGTARAFPARVFLTLTFIAGTFLSLAFVLALCGCGKGAASAGGALARLESAASSADWADAGFNPAAPLASAAPEKSRKLIKNARIQTRVENLEEAAARVEAALEQYQAYASSTSVYDTSRSYTLKIPGAHYETALREFGAIGKIVYRAETVEDTTLKYYDLEGRLNTQLALLKTFQAYLGRADNIEDIMTVEKRIAELQQEIDWYGSQLASLSHLIDYATINLELLGPASESVYYKPSIKDRIAELFGSFSGAASTALLVLLGVVIYGVPALLILTLLFWLLFGRVGLLRKLWRLAGPPKNRE